MWVRRGVEEYDDEGVGDELEGRVNTGVEVRI